HASVVKAFLVCDALRKLRHLDIPKKSLCPWRPLRLCAESLESSPRRRLLIRSRILLHLLQAGVAHVLALDEVDDVLADVARMIPDALQRAGGPYHIEHA